MKIFSWCMIACFLGSVLCTLIVNPQGEGFVRGYNVAFTFFITSAIVWAMTLPAIGQLVWRWIKSRDFRNTITQNRKTAILAIIGVVVPIVNALIIRIKAALEY